MSEFNLSQFYRNQLQEAECFSIDNSIDRTWILDNINTTIQHAKNHTPFYRCQPVLQTITTLEEIDTLPFTEKEDIKNNYPFGFLSTSLDEVTRYAESTGTTGKHSAGYVTSKEWIENNITLYLGWNQIIKTSDILLIAVPYELTYVGADIDRVSEMVGACNIACGVTRRL